MQLICSMRYCFFVWVWQTSTVSQDVTLYSGFLFTRTSTGSGFFPARLVEGSFPCLRQKLGFHLPPGRQVWPDGFAQQWAKVLVAPCPAPGQQSFCHILSWIGKAGTGHRNSAAIHTSLKALNTSPGSSIGCVLPVLYLLFVTVEVGNILNGKLQVPA